MVSSPGIRAGSVKAIAECMLMAKPAGQLGRVIFFVGAGCSVSAGVPAAPGIAKKMAVDLARTFHVGGGGSPEECYYNLFEKGRIDASFIDGVKANEADRIPENIDWYKVYDNCFERHYRSPDDVRNLFGSVIAKCDGAINWAHLCLGELVARGYISTVLTTNFDQLVLAGMASAGILPVVCDGIESLNRISPSPTHQQLVELHGSRHTYRLRNRRSDVADVAVEHSAISAVIGLFNAATTFVAVGYGGREDGVMDLLIEAARTYPDKNMFWSTYDKDPSTLGHKVVTFLSQSDNSAVLPDQDADNFFLALCRELEVGAPAAVRRPLARYQILLRNIRKSSVNHADIIAELTRSESLLGHLETHEQSFLKTETSENSVSEIRQLRLAGRTREAYHLARDRVFPIEEERVESEMVYHEFIVSASEYASSIIDSSVERAKEIFLEALAVCQKSPEIENSIQLLYSLSYIYTSLGNAYLTTGDTESARKYHESAVKADERLVDRDGSAAARRGLAISYQSLSDIHRIQDDLATAKSYLDKSLALRLKLQEEEPDNLSRLQDLSVSYDRLGDAVLEEGDIARAKELYEKGLEIDEKLAQASPDNAERQKNLVVGHAKIGDLLITSRQFESAKDHLQRALELALRIARDDSVSHRRDLHMIHLKLSNLYLRMGDLALAKSHATSSLDVARALASADSGSAVARRDVSTALTKLGNILEQEENYIEALARYKESLDIDDQLAHKDASHGTHQRDLAISQGNVADVNLKMGNIAAARELYQAMIGFLERRSKSNVASAESKSDLALALARLAQAELQAGNKDTAVSLLERSAAIMTDLCEKHEDNAAAKELADRVAAALAAAKNDPQNP